MIKVRIGCFGFLCLSLCNQKEPYLCINSAILSRKMKEDEEASNFRLSADRDLHQEGSVITSVLAFSNSFFFSMSMVTSGHLWGVKTHSVGVKVRAKRSKNLQNTGKNHIQVQNRKRSIDYNIKYIILLKNTKATGTYKSPSLMGTSSKIPTKYFTKRSANFEEIVVGLISPRPSVL